MAPTCHLAIEIAAQPHANEHRARSHRAGAACSRSLLTRKLTLMHGNFVFRGGGGTTPRGRPARLPQNAGGKGAKGGAAARTGSSPSGALAHASLPRAYLHSLFVRKLWSLCLTNPVVRGVLQREQSGSHTCVRHTATQLRQPSHGAVALPIRAPHKQHKESGAGGKGGRLQA